MGLQVWSGPCDNNNSFVLSKAFYLHQSAQKSTYYLPTVHSFLAQDVCLLIYASFSYDDNGAAENDATNVSFVVCVDVPPDKAFAQESL